MKAAQFFRLGRMIIKQVSAKRSMAENFPAHARRARVRKACVPRALGLLLVDGVPWGASAVFFKQMAGSRKRKVQNSIRRCHLDLVAEGYKRGN